ncbi:MAG: ubiquitin-like domain-containing protein [Gemmatimonadales bacterium]
MKSATIPIRVTVLDTWEELAFDLPPETTVAEVKRTALDRCRIRRPPSQYVVKYLGAELFENGTTLAEAGVVANGALIVLPRRRLPAR